MHLIDYLIQSGWLKTPEIIEAFRKIKREDFLRPFEAFGEGGLPDEMKNMAELNEALPIGFGQTISQPLTVAFMLELLQPEAGEKILDVGAGSGWTSALLAFIVRHKQSNKNIGGGKVIALELVPQLAEFGRRNVAKYNFIEKGFVEFISADGSRGYEKEAPYDKILASAAIYPDNQAKGRGAANLPESWKEQLKTGGRIVCPIESSVWLFVKKSADEFEKKEFPGFVFVPLIQKQ
ncbi:MAG: protein-L-isoaspartate O-methyltransferase [Candidatus Staskawiczbacteria bacterium]|nr:protein-L-isoaspartate O-methyltransferase [Candidatus Staskawiczbacteria bacterium]